MAECVDIRFENVLDHRKTPHGIAVQREVTNRKFALVHLDKEHPFPAGTGSFFSLCSLAH
jgi:hypothetical protein